MAINRAKFDACTCSSFRGVKTDTQTDRIALYILEVVSLMDLKDLMSATFFVMVGLVVRPKACGCAYLSGSGRKRTQV